MQLMVFFLSFQFFMLGLFTSLRARGLGLYNGPWLDNFFKIFNLKVAILSSGILILTSLILYFFNIEVYSEGIDFILINFILFFSINLIANSLVVSLLSLDK
jgi:hypothetical protein